MKIHRRKLFELGCWGAGGLAWRALATGLPAGFLVASSREAMAATERPPTSLILSVARQGDPVNANCPGSYVTGVDHPLQPELAATALTVGTTATTAALPWSTLDPALRSRLCFFHHQCATAAHTELESLLRLHGAVKGAAGNGVEMLPSMIASESREALGTIQGEPVSLGEERMSFEGRPLDNLGPSELKSLFSGSGSTLERFGALRDQALDTLYRDVKASGSWAQRRYLERFVTSRSQASALGQQLGALLSRLPVDAEELNGADDQIITAAAILKLRIAPVVTINIPFGRDNHNDAGLELEAAQTQSGVAAIGALWSELRAAGLEETTTFASLNTFGRSLRGTHGRRHNGAHHVMVMFGPRVRGGVIGGLVPLQDDFAAGSIDPSTGALRENGTISGRDSLSAAGKTLGAVVGLSRDRLDKRIPSGTIVEAALAT